MKVGTDGVLLGAWVDINNCENILDVGTGCGVIALMLAQRTPGRVRIDAIDIKEEDFLQAKKNFHSSPWKDRLTAHQVALQSFNPGCQYDCIVSNPPFFSNSLAPPNVNRKHVRHTTTLTFEELLSSSIKLLKPSGTLNLILPLTEGNSFLKMSIDRELHCNRITSFRTRPGKPVERLLMEFSFVQKPVHSSEILLYEKTNAPSEEYRSLTEEFYLNF